MAYEYRCVGAPERGKKRRGRMSRSDCVAQAMAELIAAEAADGWEYLRTDLVPVEEKPGWFGRAQEVHRGVMVFRRPLPGSMAQAFDDHGDVRFEQQMDSLDPAWGQTAPPAPAVHQDRWQGGGQPQTQWQEPRAADPQPRAERPLAPLRVPDRPPAQDMDPQAPSGAEGTGRRPLFRRQPRVEPVVPPKGLG